MKNLAPKLTPEQYERNFAEIHPPFSAGQAIAEADRCLFCFDSPCTKACPTHIDIPTFIKKIATGNLRGSARTILSSNWIALTCAKACPVDVLCEGACVYNERGEKPIAIGRLQRYAIDRYFDGGMPPLFTRAPANGRSVGVIGAGPAGLSCAMELALLGYQVTVYERRSLPGGLDTWGIAPYKMSYADSLKEVSLAQSFGVTIATDTAAGSGLPLSELERRHEARFLGIGLGRPPNLRIAGEQLRGVCDALEFIEKVTRREWSSVDIGRRVAVIGGGNTAIDAVTEAKRLGAEEVIVLYRRSEEDMPAYEFERDLAKLDGVRFHFLTAPKRFVGTTSVEGIECLRMRRGDPDERGRRSIEPMEGSEFLLPVDMVIKAIGQNPGFDFVSGIPGVRLDAGRVLVDPQTMQTGNPRYFAGGDCVNGGKEVVNAAADGKRAARGIDRYLAGPPSPTHAGKNHG